MTLGELIEVVPNDENLTLIIKNVYYPIRANFINVLRREILDLIVKDIHFNRGYNETAIIVTLESPHKGVSNDVHIDGMDMETL